MFKEDWSEETERGRKADPQALSLLLAHLMGTQERWLFLLINTAWLFVSNLQ